MRTFNTLESQLKFMFNGGKLSSPSKNSIYYCWSKECDTIHNDKGVAIDFDVLQERESYEEYVEQRFGGHHHWTHQYSNVKVSIDYGTTIKLLEMLRKDKMIAHGSVTDMSNLNDFEKTLITGGYEAHINDLECAYDVINDKLTDACKSDEESSICP